VGINEKIFLSEIGFNIMEYSQPQGFGLKKREHNLRSVVNWQGVLKQIGVKQLVGVLLTETESLPKTILTGIFVLYLFLSFLYYFSEHP
jgi:hypothetical protein